jgi:hypothetical protein
MTERKRRNVEVDDSPKKKGKLEGLSKEEQRERAAEWARKQGIAVAPAPAKRRTQEEVSHEEEPQEDQDDDIASTTSTRSTRSTASRTSASKIPTTRRKSVGRPRKVETIEENNEEEEAEEVEKKGNEEEEPAKPADVRGRRKKEAEEEEATVSTAELSSAKKLPSRPLVNVLAAPVKTLPVPPPVAQAAPVVVPLPPAMVPAADAAPFYVEPEPVSSTKYDDTVEAEIETARPTSAMLKQAYLTQVYLGYLKQALLMVYLVSLAYVFYVRVDIGLAVLVSASVLAALRRVVSFVLRLASPLMATPSTPSTPSTSSTKNSHSTSDPSSSTPASDGRSEQTAKVPMKPPVKATFAAEKSAEIVAQRQKAKDWEVKMKEKMAEQKGNMQ